MQAKKFEMHFAIDANSLNAGQWPFFSSMAQALKLTKDRAENVFPFRNIKEQD